MVALSVEDARHVCMNRVDNCRRLYCGNGDQQEGAHCEAKFRSFIAVIPTLILVSSDQRSTPSETVVSHRKPELGVRQDARGAQKAGTVESRAESDVAGTMHALCITVLACAATLLRTVMQGQSSDSTPGAMLR